MQKISEAVFALSFWLHPPYHSTEMRTALAVLPSFSSVKRRKAHSLLAPILN